MNIEVKGNSGCDIEIIEENNKLYVNKTCSESYNKRLLSQGEKQKNALKTSLISVPNVYINEPGLIKMDYVYGKNFVDFFERAPFTSIDTFVNTICEYIDFEIINSKMTEIPITVFLEKLNSIRENCKRNEFASCSSVENILNDAEEIFKRYESIKIPVGMCHGDFTFSNIMFSETKFYLIDFLDSFIETPLQDIVKLRQDSQFLWSTLMYTKQYDDIRIKMVFKYIDDKIDKHFAIYDFYDYYNMLQLMNMLRILPYTKNADVFDYLDETINNIIKEFDL